MKQGGKEMQQPIEIQEFNLELITDEQIKEVLKECIQAMKKKKFYYKGFEVLPGVSSFNLYVAPMGIWWVEDYPDGDVYEMIDFLVDSHELSEYEAEEWREDGVDFLLTIVEEHYGDIDSFAEYDLQSAKESVDGLFKELKADYYTYLDGILSTD